MLRLAADSCNYWGISDIPCVILSVGVISFDTSSQTSNRLDSHLASLADMGDWRAKLQLAYRQSNLSLFRFRYHRAERNTEADSDKELYEQFWKINFQAERTVQYQSRLVQNLARVSPLGSYVAAATTLAETGLEDAHRYKGYVLRWDRQRRDLEDNPLNPNWDQTRREQAGLYYTPTRMSLHESLATIWVDAALLILFNLIFFMGTYLSFLRYSVQ